MSLLPCDQPVNVIGDLVSSLTICHDQSRILSHGIAHAHLTFHLSESPMVSVTSHPEAATSHIAAKLAFLKFKSPLCLKPFWVPRDPQIKSRCLHLAFKALPSPVLPGSLNSSFPLSSPVPIILPSSQTEAFPDPRSASNNLIVAYGFASSIRRPCDRILIWVWN